MKCTKCNNHQTKVISMKTFNNGVVCRKRKCSKCGHVFETFEGCYSLEDTKKLFSVVEALNKKYDVLKAKITSLEEKEWAAKRRCKHWVDRAAAEGVLLGEGGQGV